MSCDATGVTESVTEPKTAASAPTPNQNRHISTVLPVLPSIAEIQPEQIHSMVENNETRDDPTQFDDLAKVLELDVNFEYDASATPQPCVKGNLRKNVAFWESIECNKFVLGAIKRGYKLYLFLVIHLLP